MNHVHLPAQPRAQEHTGWNPFVQASATDKHNLDHFLGSEGSSNGEMLGVRARQKSFYLIKCSHFFSLSPYCWSQSGTAKLFMSQQLLLLSQPWGSLEQLSASQADSEHTGNAALIKHRPPHTRGTCTHARVRLAKAFATHVREWRNLPSKQKGTKRRNNPCTAERAVLLTCL